MAKVTKDMLMGEVLRVDPNMAAILVREGMHCVGCPASSGETLEEAAQVHNYDVNVLLQKLNDFFGE